MDIAIIEAGDATIRRIDRLPVRTGNGGTFEIRPGSHTFEVTAHAMRPGFMVIKHWQSGLVSLCLKAKGGRRYRIESTIVDDRMRIIVVDASTGKPPITPCGPDEDDD